MDRSTLILKWQAQVLNGWTCTSKLRCLIVWNRLHTHRKQKQHLSETRWLAWSFCDSVRSVLCGPRVLHHTTATQFRRLSRQPGTDASSFKLLQGDFTGLHKWKQLTHSGVGYIRQIWYSHVEYSHRFIVSLWKLLVLCSLICCLGKLTSFKWTEIYPA